MPIPRLFFTAVVLLFAAQPVPAADPPWPAGSRWEGTRKLQITDKNGQKKLLTHDLGLVVTKREKGNIEGVFELDDGKNKAKFEGTVGENGHLEFKLTKPLTDTFPSDVIGHAVYAGNLAGDARTKAEGTYKVTGPKARQGSWELKKVSK